MVAQDDSQNQKEVVQAGNEVHKENVSLIDSMLNLKLHSKQKNYHSTQRCKQKRKENMC